MKIINLMEDTPGEAGCLFEHGLCFYVETAGHKLLMDTGASDAILKNAKLLGLDLRQVDTVILSHGHYDHSGGIMAFAEKNPSANIYMRPTAGEDYYSLRETGEAYIGIDKRILSLPQVRFTGEIQRIDGELSLFSGIRGKWNQAKSNRRLKHMQAGELLQDTFAHEQCLVVREDGKNWLFSGCAHSGILNILDRYRELYGQDPAAVISGFHLVQKEDYGPEELRMIREMAWELMKWDTIFYTGHCTGKAAYDLMKEIMGEKLREIHSGMRIR